ncbi:hypothetical protein N9V90_00660 [Endozoicomonas sp.]|nr:hypothetical protein [Endozoicomonas sp.]
MRLAVTMLALCTLTLQHAKSDDAQLKLHPPEPNPIKLIYDTALSGNTAFCAATPVQQNLSIQVDCTGSPACTSEYTLTGSGNNTLPIQLQFTDNYNNNFELAPNQQYKNLESQGANCGNNGNVRTITVNVNKNDIDWTKAPFSRTFQVTARNISKDRIETEEFTVTFGEKGLIRISGLKDLALNHDNDWQTSNEQVCVVSSTPFYRLTATSANNGELKNNTHGIPYTLQYRQHGSAIWKDMNFGTSYQNLIPSSTERCADGTYLGIQATLQERSLMTAPTGNYSDTVTVVVEAG